MGLSIHYVPTDKRAANIFRKSLALSKWEFSEQLCCGQTTQSAHVREGGVKISIKFIVLNFVRTLRDFNLKV